LDIHTVNKYIHKAEVKIPLSNYNELTNIKNLHLEYNICLDTVSQIANLYYLQHLYVRYISASNLDNINTIHLIDVDDFNTSSLTSCVNLRYIESNHTIECTDLHDCTIELVGDPSEMYQKIVVLNNCSDISVINYNLVRCNDVRNLCVNCTDEFKYERLYIQGVGLDILYIDIESKTQNDRLLDSITIRNTILSHLSNLFITIDGEVNISDIKVGTRNLLTSIDILDAIKDKSLVFVNNRIKLNDNLDLYAY
jgi:hypothetical protein